MPGETHDNARIGFGEFLYVPWDNRGLHQDDVANPGLQGAKRGPAFSSIESTIFRWENLRRLAELPRKVDVIAQAFFLLGRST